MRDLRPGYYKMPFRFAAMDPEKLTEPGRDHLKIAIRHERILWLWLAGGVLIIMILGALS
jgi:hypothetical protein